MQRVSEKRIVERGREEDLVQAIVPRVQVLVLGLIEHHEPVMLFEDMVVAPKLSA